MVEEEEDVQPQVKKRSEKHKGAKLYVSCFLRYDICLRHSSLTDDPLENIEYYEDRCWAQ